MQSILKNEFHVTYKLDLCSYLRENTARSSDKDQQENAA